MTLQVLSAQLSICRVGSVGELDLSRDLYFIGRTDEEISLVCRREDVPAAPLERSDGWRGFRIRGTLDFSLVGILSRITRLLAEEEISVFALSTYNTDYVLMREEKLEQALAALSAAGYQITREE